MLLVRICNAYKSPPSKLNLYFFLRSLFFLGVRRKGLRSPLVIKGFPTVLDLKQWVEFHLLFRGQLSDIDPSAQDRVMTILTVRPRTKALHDLFVTERHRR